MTYEEMIQQAKALKGKDLTPDIVDGEWESTFYDEYGFPNSHRADTPEEAVRMAYNALMGVK